MRRLLLVPALAATLLLAACEGPAEFAAPLSEPGTAPYDEALIGSWYALSPDADGVTVLVIKAGEDSTLDAAFGYMSVSPGKSGSAGVVWLDQTAHASVIGGKTYYNARLTEGGMISQEWGQPLDMKGDPLLAPHPDHGYWILRAEIGDDGVLTVHVLTETLPKSRKIASHEVSCGTDCDFTVYDLGPAELAALIGAEPYEDLFTMQLPFARFGAPPPPKPE